MKCAGVMAEFIGPNDDGVIEAIDFYILQAGADNHWELCEQVGVATEALVEEWMKDSVTQRIRAGELPRDLPCLMPELYLRRLRRWTPWLVALHYLDSQQMNMVCLFKNTPLDVEMTHYPGEAIKVYPTVIKAFPELDWKKNGGV